MLTEMFDQFRWYYNSVVDIVTRDKLETKYFSKLRDEIMKYDYVNEDGVQTFKRGDAKEFFNPGFWKKVHTRLIRGTIHKFRTNITSANSNRKNFLMKKKDKVKYMLFEDKQFPAFIKYIKSHYWFRINPGKRKKISFLDIFNSTQQRGLEITRKENKYFINYPVDENWYPELDLRNEKQVLKREQVISLDPGIRKFMTGYDPSGKFFLFGDKASLIILDLLYQIDNGKVELWSRVKNLVSELHWKVAHFLVTHYENVLLPDFRISKMVRSKKLAPSTKRMMYMFSFHSFKEKMIFKANQHNCNLYIVNEAYTSKTCTNCGILNDSLGSSELFECGSCGIKIDRDVAGSRNILIKNGTLS